MAFWNSLFLYVQCIYLIFLKHILLNQENIKDIHSTHVYQLLCRYYDINTVFINFENRKIIIFVLLHMDWPIWTANDDLFALIHIWGASCTVLDYTNRSDSISNFTHKFIRPFPSFFKVWYIVQQLNLYRNYG